MIITERQFLFYLAKFCLLPSNEVIALIIIIGLYSRYRTYFIHASYLLFFSMIFNCLLKSVFQMPLNPQLGIVGHAFPSGHMQASMAFYCYFILTFRNISLQFLLILVLLGIGVSLVYLEYHNYQDVMGGVMAGLITAIFYERWQKIVKLETIGVVLFCVSSIMLLILSCKYSIKVNAWFAYFGIITLNFASFIKNNKKYSLNGR